jgi:predicted SAM-dependent methyltransferase
MVEECELTLEVGCGDKKDYADSIGLDIRRTGKVDVVADARTLPFVDGCFGRVYSSHTLEHFSHREIRLVLSEWVRILKPGGTLEIRCPDLRARALLFAIRPSWNDVENIYGSQDYPENLHKSGYSYGLLKRLLRQLGIEGMKRVIRGYKGIPFIPDSIHITGTKHFANAKTGITRRKEQKR